MRAARLVVAAVAACAGSVALAALEGCDTRSRADPPAATGAAPRATAPGATALAATPPSADSEPLRVPAESSIPAGELGAAVRRGRALVLYAHDSLPAHAPSPSIRCQSCHLDEGTRAGAAPWPGVVARFPQYRSRSGEVIRIEDRVNNCFTRSLNGRALDVAGRDMRDIVAYLAWLSTGYRVGGVVAGQGFRRVAAPHAPSGDAASGHALYAAQCARCHGDGQGTAVAPALWGARSYNGGASMAQIRTAAGFIRHQMPFDRPGTLTDSQAYDLAAYVNAHERPAYALAARDWPRGDAPDDAPHATARRAPPAPVATPR